MTFVPIWGAKYNDRSEDLLLSSLDLLVKYQLIDTYREFFVHRLVIHQVTRNNVRLILREQGIEEEVINRAMFFFEAVLGESKHLLKSPDESILLKESIKDTLPDLCSNAQHVLHHAKKYKTLDQPGKSLELLIDYFAQKELYRKQDFITINQ